MATDESAKPENWRGEFLERLISERKARAAADPDARRDARAATPQPVSIGDWLAHLGEAKVAGAAMMRAALPGDGPSRGLGVPLHVLQGRHRELREGWPNN